MTGTTALIQTVSILGAALAFVTKLAFDAWSKRRNGKDSGFLTQNQRDRYLADLEQSHRPVSDPESGQPHFPWYDDTRSILPEIRRLIESIDKLTEIMKTCQDRCVIGAIKEDR